MSATGHALDVRMGPGRGDEKLDLPSLTGLRWIAAFLVFGYHLHVVEYFAPDRAGAKVLDGLFNSGSVGVSFFFILSGFVLMWSSPRTASRRFWWRRFARVYPLHLGTAVLVLLLVCTHTLGDLPALPVVLANLFLVQSWSAGTEYVQSLNTVSWTLSCEAFFYLLFPLIAAGVARLRLRGLTVLAAGAAVVVTAGPLAGRQVASTHAVNWFFHWNPVGRLPEFVFGVTLAAMVRIVHVRRPGRLGLLWSVAGLVTVAGYLLARFAPDPWGHAACTMLGFGLVLVAAALSDAWERWTPWRSRLVVRLGELSFAFYLVHLIVVRVLEQIVGYHPRLDNSAAAALSVLTFALSLTMAWLLHIGLERPARTLLLSRRRAAGS